MNVLNNKILWSYYQEGDPFQGPKVGSCLTLGNELSEETHLLTKQETLLGRGAGWKAGGEGNPGELLCHMARSLRFYGDGISFRVVFSQSSDSESFLMVHALFSQDGCQREGFWEVVGLVVSPFDLSWILPVGGGLLVPCSLPGPHANGYYVPGQGGQFQSLCFP